MSEEKRIFQRSTCEGTAELQLFVNAPTLSARIVNLSVEGCFIVLSKPVWLPLDSPVELTFNVNRLPFRVRGILKSNQLGKSLGFHFPILSKRVHLQLEDLVEELAEDLKHYKNTN